MEWLRRMKLKKALFIMTFASLFIATLLSALSFWACFRFRGSLSSDMVEIRMDSGSFAVAESETAALSAQEVIGAEIISVLQIVLPVAFYVTAMVATASLFYRLKLKEPLEILTNGAGRIMENDLDFVIEAGGEDELGQLCTAFETMRQSLLKNNRELWRQAEERRRLNAAFSHDLRNPLTVLKGSVKMARQCVEKEIANSPASADSPGNGIAGDSPASADSPGNGIVGDSPASVDGPGNSTMERDSVERGAAEKLLMENLVRVESYTSRIEQYVEAMSSAGRLEEVMIERKAVCWNTLTGELEKAMGFIVSDSGRQFSFSSKGDGGIIVLDKNILFQIAENLMSNAVRYADRQVSVSLTLDGHTLSLEVADDGKGFPAEVLKNGIKPFQKGSEEAGHFGMGLYICSVLCQKHGGSLRIQNRKGALVCAVLAMGEGTPDKL